jgi:hypothetical protein
LSARFQYEPTLTNHRLQRPSCPARGPGMAM